MTTRTELLEIINNGENSGVEFKRDTLQNHDLAKELVAFSNLGGGMVLLGVEDDGEGMEGATVSKNPCTFVRPSSGPGRSSFCPGSRTGAAAGRRIPYPMMYGMKKSDEAIVPWTAANKGAQAPAESPEGRASTKGNSRDQSTHRTQGRDGVLQAVERIRQAATRAVCRQPPKVGAVCVNAHVRI